MVAQIIARISIKAGNPLQIQFAAKYGVIRKTQEYNWRLTEYLAFNPTSLHSHHPLLPPSSAPITLKPAQSIDDDQEFGIATCRRPTRPK